MPTKIYIGGKTSVEYQEASFSVRLYTNFSETTRACAH